MRRARRQKLATRAQGELAPGIEDRGRELDPSHSPDRSGRRGLEHGRLVGQEQLADDGYGQLGLAANQRLQRKLALFDGLSRERQHPGGRPERSQFLNLGPPKVRGLRQPGMKRRTGAVHALSQTGQEREPSDASRGIFLIVPPFRLEQTEKRT